MGGLYAGYQLGNAINNWAYGDDLAQAAGADARADMLQERLLDRLTAANGLLGQGLALSKAQDSGKNEPHGDSGREVGKIQERLKELQDQLAELERTQGPKKVKDKIKKTIENITKDALDKAKGETHGRKGKGT